MRHQGTWSTLAFAAFAVGCSAPASSDSPTIAESGIGPGTDAGPNDKRVSSKDAEPGDRDATSKADSAPDDGGGRGGTDGATDGGAWVSGQVGINLNPVSYYAGDHAFANVAWSFK